MGNCFCGSTAPTDTSYGRYPEAHQKDMWHWRLDHAACREQAMLPPSGDCTCAWNDGDTTYRVLTERSSACPSWPHSTRSPA